MTHAWKWIQQLFKSFSKQQENADMVEVAKATTAPKIVGTTVAPKTAVRKEKPAAVPGKKTKEQLRHLPPSKKEIATATKADAAKKTADAAAATADAATKAK